MSDFKLSPVNALHNKALASDKMVMLLTEGTVDPDDAAEVNGAMMAAMEASRVYYPETYGAVGDGVTNDDAAVQAAIDAAELTGGTVVLSKFYGLTSGVIIDKGWVKLEGQTAGSSFTEEPKCGFKPLATNTVCVTVKRSPGSTEPVRGIVFRDFAIIGTSPSSSSQVGISLLYTSGITTDCPIVDHVNLQWLAWGLKSENDDSLNITNSRICDCKQGIFLKTIINAIVSNNIIYDNTEYGCSVDGGYGLVFSANECGRDNITLKAFDVRSATITGNLFHNDDSYSLFTRTRAMQLIGSGGPAGDSRYIVSGNIFVDLNPVGATTAYSQDMLSIAAASNTAIIGNSFFFENTTRPAIYLTNAYNPRLIGNTFSPKTPLPIFSENNSRGVSLQANIYNGTVTLPTDVWRVAAPNPLILPTFADDAACTSVLTNSTTTNGTAAVTVSSATGLMPGMSVSGSGIPAGTTILTVDSTTTLTLTKNATATSSTVSLTFALRSGTPYKTSTGEMRVKL